MIGNKVTFNNNKRGVVIEKFRGFYRISVELPSGSGGTTTSQQAVNVDYYKIKGNDGKQYNVLCSEVWLED